MSRPLVGKLAIVTGASRGIGTAIAANLASKGANLILNYTTPSSQSRTEELAAKLSAEHKVKAVVVQADMGTESGPQKLLDDSITAFASDGKFQVDILINNAGIARNGMLTSPIKSSGDPTAKAFTDCYAVNVLGPLLLVEALTQGKHWPTDRSGRIVNLSSVSSTTGFLGQSIYGGTKAALEAMTRTWARELSENCTVNAVNPGPVLTEMYASNSDLFKRHIKSFIEHAPLMRAREGIDPPELVEDAQTSGGRPAYPEEVAGIVGMLCGPEAAWCTGQVVCANGGMIMLH